MHSLDCPACGRKYEAIGPADPCPACAPSGANVVNRPRIDFPQLNQPRPSGSARSFPVLWIILIAVGVLAMAGVWLGVQVVRQEGFAGETLKRMCRDNLMRLYQGLKIYERETGSPPAATGSAFWEAVAERQGLKDELECAAAAVEDEEIDVPYRGPSAAWKDLAPEAIIACDREKSHKDGLFVMFKDGRIEFAPKGSELRRRALADTEE